jgi:transcriptional regulator with XRE-family HTH domain
MGSGTTLGERLKSLVKEKGMEQQEVAAVLGIKPPTFSGYVINKREPPFEKLKQFADFFSVSIDFLLGHSEIKDPYLRHLPGDLDAFVRDPANVVYLELAREIKAKTEALAGARQARER